MLKQEQDGAVLPEADGRVIGGSSSISSREDRSQGACLPEEKAEGSAKKKKGIRRSSACARTCFTPVRTCPRLTASMS